ncbi:MAG TPA: DUF2306 domain-containing protein [Rhizomicrobium sp.]|nr:DUF2306 domain-containing protein [Rhizomicrobium sp.]
MTVDASSLVPEPARSFRLPRAKYLLAAAITLMYLYVLWTNESFLFNPRDPEWQHIAPFKMILLPHGLAAAFALFLGPLQFSERLRRKYIGLHRITGYLYIAGCYIGAPIGIYIEYFEERLGEPRSFTIATIVDAAIWMFATTMALIFIRQGKVQQHRQWMTRSFACALIFLEVRAVNAFFQIPVTQIETVVWCCVAAAFPLADLVLQLEEQLRQRARPARVSVR